MFVKIPIIGSVRCGEPIFAESNIEGYENVYVGDILNGETYFFLRAKGDSMINAGIDEGDLLLVRVQSDVDSGDIAIVNIDGDRETLKRLIKKDKAIILQPENPAYETKIFMGKELNEVHIQGRLMQVVKKFKNYMKEVTYMKKFINEILLPILGLIVFYIFSYNAIRHTEYFSSQ